ncbi:Poly(A) RNA polymerase cid13 [Orobanche hederae]
MAVVENAGANAMTSSNWGAQQNDVAAPDHHQPSMKAAPIAKNSTKPTDRNFQPTQQKIPSGHHHPVNGNGDPPEKNTNGGNDGGEGFKMEMRDLEEMLSKLNPMAEEFVPLNAGVQHNFLVAPSHAAVAGHFGYNANGFIIQQLVNSGISTGNSFRKKKNDYIHGKRRMNSRTSMAQSKDVIRRTVYVSDIDHQVTEEQLAALFISCGQVVDCRICGDPNSVLRFAFVEFTDEEGARDALSLAGTMLGYYPVKVLPSKTAIAPVNPTFLPRSEDEREMCARTIYCTNIDKKVTQADVKLFFESICGEVYRLRLLGDYHHPTRISFVEFVMAESAIAALNCSGVVLGSLPIRVSPSKTPVRHRTPRQFLR